MPSSWDLRLDKGDSTHYHWMHSIPYGKRLSTSGFDTQIKPNPSLGQDNTSQTVWYLTSKDPPLCVNHDQTNTKLMQTGEHTVCVGWRAEIAWMLYTRHVQVLCLCAVTQNIIFINCQNLMQQQVQTNACECMCALQNIVEHGDWLQASYLLNKSLSRKNVLT